MRCIREGILIPVMNNEIHFFSSDCVRARMCVRVFVYVCVCMCFCVPFE